SAGQIEAAARRLDPVRLDARLVRANARLSEAAQAVRRTTSRTTTRADANLDAVAARVSAADPARALARGWSLTHTADGRLVRSPDDVAPGHALVTTLARGQVRSTVTDTPIAHAGDDSR
ncbi:MAG TPA: exodeoxyribonuclease VII large subunit, partial [Acidimicrobiales bacterium]|nr:exodeoxyribonuclease VII large subunit [Acidimicrobiales bacterium]